MRADTFPVGECELYVEEAGAGPPTLLIHGAGAFSGLFRPLMDELATTHRVISYDRRGYSRSLHAPVFDIRIHAQDAARLIVDHIREPVIVAGWSAGAMVALHLAASFPELTTALVLAEPSLQLHAPYPPALMAVARWELNRLVFGREAGARVFFRWVSQYRAGGNAFEKYPEEWQVAMAENARPLFAELRLGGGAMGERMRRSTLAALQVPTQILLGECSARVFAPAARYLSRLLKPSELVSVPASGHMIPTDRPDAIATAVRKASARGTQAPNSFARAPVAANSHT